MRSSIHDLANTLSGIRGILELSDVQKPLSPRDRARLAVAELDGPDAGLAALDGVELDAYAPFHATRADLLRRAGRTEEAAAAYDAALERTTVDAERRFLSSRRGSLA